MRQRAILVSVLLLSLIAGGCAGPSTRASSEKESKGRRPAPEFSLKDADGKTVQLSDYRGKVVLLNFWATWCGPCKYEIPWFVEFERNFKHQGLVVLGVSMDDDGWDVVKPFTSNAGINYRIVLGNDTVAQQYGGVDSLPTTFLIDRNGKIAATHIGLVSKSTYENDLKQLLQSSERNSSRFRFGVPALLAGTNR